MFDDLAKGCLALMLVPLLAYVAVIRAQYLGLSKKTYRLTVLCVRTAVFLPLYAFLMYISALVPRAYVLITVIITVVEGYSFYCFLSLITTNLGGPAAAVDLMYQAQRQLFCSCCCPADSAAFYQKTTWAIFHLFITRSVLSVISAIVFYAGGEKGKVVFMAINVVSAVILFYAVICLVNFCKFHCLWAPLQSARLSPTPLLFPRRNYLRTLYEPLRRGEAAPVEGERGCDRGTGPDRELRVQLRGLTVRRR